MSNILTREHTRETAFAMPLCKHNSYDTQTASFNLGSCIHQSKTDSSLTFFTCLRLLTEPQVEDDNIYSHTNEQVIQLFYFHGTAIRPEVASTVPTQATKRQDQQQKYGVPYIQAAHTNQHEISSNAAVNNELRCGGNEFNCKPTEHDVRGHDSHCFGCVVWNW